MGGLSAAMISADRTNDAILWVMGNNVLNAIDATVLTNLLYSSNSSGTRDSIGITAHFAIPMIAGGRVYVGTTSQLIVFGLFPGLSPVAGNNQSGAAKTTLPVPLQVQALDPYSGTVYPGVSVTFSDGGKGGTFGSPTAATDSNGIASTTYTLPQRAAQYTITASSSGPGSITFHETAVAGSPKRIASVSGNGQTAPVSSPLPAPLVVAVLDAFGNSVSGVTVSFSDGGAGGSSSSPTATTNNFGRASFTYTTPPNAGKVTIIASVGSLTPVKFSETVTSP
jgi:hypothetical protein